MNLPSKHVTRWAVATAAMILGLTAPREARAQRIEENFNTATGAGGVEVLFGSGDVAVAGFDTGISGENAFAGTAGNTQVNPASAQGTTNGGVGGTGAGIVDVLGVTFHTLAQAFESITGAGGGAFLSANGQPDTFGFTANWDDGITGEGAFGGTGGGATLVGSMVAEGVFGGGAGGSEAGRITVTDVTVGAGEWFAGLQFSMGPLPASGTGAAALANPGFEAGNVGPAVPGWTRAGNAFTEDDAPRTGIRHLKMFGNFTGGFNTTTVTQQLAAVPGQNWRLDCFSRHNPNDAITATQNYMLMRIEYLNASNAVLLSADSTILSATSPTGFWIDNAPLSLTAPAGTVAVRPSLQFVQPAVGLFQPGAGFVDDVTFDLVSGPPLVNLASIFMTANVKGETSGAGSTLGGYQLRIEDADGDRLIFNGTANGAFQSLGGALSTAIEANTNGVPTVGAFNPTSPSFNVVVAFANGTWGTGGRLTADNVIVTDNQPGDDSAWFAGMFFDELSLSTTDLSQLMLLADVKGSVPGGKMVARVEGVINVQSALNEDFESVAGDVTKFIDGGAGGIIGPIAGFTPGWDIGITGESAFGGTFGPTVEIFAGGGFTASGLTAGGNGGGGAGEIKVEDVIFGPGDGWYAGLGWGGQGLASADLSQVTLTAQVKGTATSGGGLGPIEMRIEDAQGDRLYVTVVANGNWQSMGGTLNTFTEAGAAGGGGDGTFNLDSTSYTVVVAFIQDPQDNGWAFGGTIAVDNLFLTPVTAAIPVGEIGYTATATGGFQTLGGVLADGVSTFIGDFDEDFETATGTGGGAAGGPWDSGLAGESSFGGSFGGAIVGGGIFAQACLSCGFNGTKAGQLNVDNIVPNAGGWFAGLFWAGQPADLSGDLSQVFLTARVRATVDAPGEALGTFIFRIEDDGQDELAFDVIANGAWQNVGGALSTAIERPIAGLAGDGVFNFNAPSYTVTLAMVGTAANWGPGATLTIDDLFLTIPGRSFADVDGYTVTVTFEDELATWGTSGRLTVDNLLLTQFSEPDCDLDADVDLRDYAFLQACLQPSGAIVGGCACANYDLDTTIDRTDYRIFAPRLTGP